MADITDPTILGYVNNVIRPFKDRYVGMKQAGDVEISRFHATIKLTADWIQASDSDVILDGSAGDARTPLTKGDVTAMLTQMEAFRTQGDIPGVMEVLIKGSVNPNLP